MKLMDITEENTPIEKRALWWKTYSHRIQDELWKLRGRMSNSIKKCITQGTSMICNILNELSYICCLLT